MNPAASELLGNPSSVTLVTSGLDLVVIADGPLRLEISKRGTSRFRMRRIPLRQMLHPGSYALSRGHYQNLKGIVFRGALMHPVDQVVLSPEQRRAARRSCRDA